MKARALSSIIAQQTKQMNLIHYLQLILYSIRQLISDLIFPRVTTKIYFYIFIIYCCVSSISILLSRAIITFCIKFLQASPILTVFH